MILVVRLSDSPPFLELQDGVAAKRAAIAHLQGMSARNQKDAVMAKQVNCCGHSVTPSNEYTVKVLRGGHHDYHSSVPLKALVFLISVLKKHAL